MKTIPFLVKKSDAGESIKFIFKFDALAIVEKPISI